MKISRRSGHRGMLADTLLAAFIMALVTTLIFGAVTAADRMFHQSSLRAGLQSDAMKFSATFKRDAALSDFWRAQVVNRSTAAGHRRDGMALVALSNWDDPTRFEAATSLPQWDRYIVYYATTKDPVRLIRQVIRPSPLPSNLTAYLALATNLNDFPGDNKNPEQTSVLSSDVRSLEIAKAVQNGSIEAKLHLRRQGLKRANSNDTVIESLETSVTVRLQNTWPKI